MYVAWDYVQLRSWVTMQLSCSGTSVLISFHLYVQCEQDIEIVIPLRARDTVLRLTVPFKLKIAEVFALLFI